MSSSSRRRSRKRWGPEVVDDGDQMHANTAPLRAVESMAAAADTQEAPSTSASSQQPPPSRSRDHQHFSPRDAKQALNRGGVNAGEAALEQPSPAPAAPILEGASAASSISPAAKNLDDPMSSSRRARRSRWKPEPPSVQLTAHAQPTDREKGSETIGVPSDQLPAQAARPEANISNVNDAQLSAETAEAEAAAADARMPPKKRRRHSRFHPEPQDAVAALAAPPQSAAGTSAALATGGIVAAARDRLAAQVAAAAQAAAAEEEAAAAAKAAAKAAAPPPAWALRLSGDNSVFSSVAQQAAGSPRLKTAPDGLAASDDASDMPPKLTQSSNPLVTGHGIHSEEGSSPPLPPSSPPPPPPSPPVDNGTLHAIKPPQHDATVGVTSMRERKLERQPRQLRKKKRQRSATPPARPHRRGLSPPPRSRGPAGSRRRSPSYEPLPGANPADVAATAAELRRREAPPSRRRHISPTSRRSSPDRSYPGSGPPLLRRPGSPRDHMHHVPPMIHSYRNAPPPMLQHYHQDSDYPPVGRRNSPPPRRHYNGPPGGQRAIPWQEGPGPDTFALSQRRHRSPPVQPRGPPVQRQLTTSAERSSRRASSRSARRAAKTEEAHKQEEASEEGELSEGEIVASHADLAEAAAKKAAADAEARPLPTPPDLLRGGSWHDPDSRPGSAATPPSVAPLSGRSQQTATTSRNQAARPGVFGSPPVPPPRPPPLSELSALNRGGGGRGGQQRSHLVGGMAMMGRGGGIPVMNVMGNMGMPLPLPLIMGGGLLHGAAMGRGRGRGWLG